MDRNAINRSDLARREFQNPTHQFYVQKKTSTSTSFQPFNSPEGTPSFPPLRMQTQTSATTKMPDISPKRAVAMETDKKVLTLMQQIVRASGKDQIVRRKEKK